MGNCNTAEINCWPLGAASQHSKLLFSPREPTRERAATKSFKSAESSFRNRCSRASTFLDDYQQMWELRKEYAGFLSHYKKECAMEARHCKFFLERRLQAPLFIDSDDLQDLRMLLRQVCQCDVLLFLQTKGVLGRPWCLLELLTAIDNDVPIVAINIKGPDAYSFEAAPLFLQNLEVELSKINPDAEKVLYEQGVDLKEAAYKLSCVLPNIISIPFDPSGSESSIKASLDDIVCAMRKAAPLPLNLPMEAWLETRSRRLSAQPTSSVDVVCRFNLFDVTELNQEKRTVFVRFYFEAAWPCPAAARPGWSRKKHASDLDLKHASDIDWTEEWGPKIVFTNALGTLNIEAWHAIDPQYAIKFDGPMASWRAKVAGYFVMPRMDFERFPYDSHQLSILVSSDHPTSVCCLKPNALVPSVLRTDKLLLNNTWLTTCPVAHQLARTREDRPGAQRNSYPQLSIFHIEISRRLENSVKSGIVIVFFMVGVAISAFVLLPIDASHRTQLIAIVMIAIIVSKVAVDTHTPQVCYLTDLDKYFLVSIAIPVFVVIETLLLGSLGQTAVQGEWNTTRFIDKLFGVLTAALWSLLHIAWATNTLSFSAIRSNPIFRMAMGNPIAAATERLQPSIKTRRSLFAEKRSKSWEIPSIQISDEAESNRRTSKPENEGDRRTSKRGSLHVPADMLRVESAPASSPATPRQNSEPKSCESAKATTWPARPKPKEIEFIGSEIGVESRELCRMKTPQANVPKASPSCESSLSLLRVTSAPPASAPIAEAQQNL